MLCVVCGELGGPDLVLNVLLFAPLGLVLGTWRVRFIYAVGVGLGLSGLVESAQLFLEGRSSTARDLLTNAFGTGVGAWVALSWRSWLAPGLRAKSLLSVGVLAFLFAVGLTGRLLGFAPLDRTYFANWVPVQGHLEKWTGELLDVEVGRTKVSHSRYPNPAPIRRELVDTVRIRVLGLAGEPTQRVGGIFSIVTDRQEEILLLGVQGTDAVIRVRRLAAAFHFDAPSFRFRHALDGVSPGTTFEIRFVGTRRGATLAVNGALHRVGRLPAGSSWRFARAFDNASVSVTRALDMLAIALISFPVGLWLRSVSRAQAATAVTAVLIGFPAVSWWAGLALPAPPEWAGLLLAGALGWVLSRRLGIPRTP